MALYKAFFLTAVRTWRATTEPGGDVLTALSGQIIEKDESNDKALPLWHLSTEQQHELTAPTASKLQGHSSTSSGGRISNRVNGGVRLHAVAGCWKGCAVRRLCTTADAKTKLPNAVCDHLLDIPDPMALFRTEFMILVDL